MSRSPLSLADSNENVYLDLSALIHMLNYYNDFPETLKETRTLEMSNLILLISFQLGLTEWPNKH